MSKAEGVKVNVRYLEATRDFTEARHGKEARHSIQACEQSNHAHGHDGTVSAGRKDIAGVL